MRIRASKLEREHDAHIAFSADIMAEVHAQLTRIEGTWALRIANEPSTNNMRMQQYLQRRSWHALGPSERKIAAYRQWVTE